MAISSEYTKEELNYVEGSKAAKTEKSITANKTERETEENKNDENAEGNSFVLG